jgi:aspartokinase
MANFEIIFKDFILPENITAKIESRLLEKHINIYFIDDTEYKYCFTMDKSTAIKFAKTLRAEINKITESEVSNE